MSKFLLRHGLRMPNKSWGVTRRKWLGSLTFPYAHQQQAFQTYLHALDLVDRRIEALDGTSTGQPRTVRGRNSSPGCAACAASTR